MSVSVYPVSHLNTRLTMYGLSSEAKNYEYFRCVFYQNGSQILNYKESVNYAAYSFYFEFSNASYLGYNWFSPATEYSVTVYGKINGVEETIGSNSFTTDSISPPTGTISPTVYPTMKNQGSFGNCVAMSLSTAMEIFKSKAMGYSTSYENFSVSYIYGSDGGTGEYMMFREAIHNCINHGSPRWELVTTSFPDSLSKAASVAIFNSKTSLAITNAGKQKLTYYTSTDFYDCNAVQNAISTHGCFMFNFAIPNNFYSVGSDGIVPQPGGGWSGQNHSMALIGLTTINSKKYWIGHNSWGAGWGINGLCYVPYDWGCGVQSPYGSSNTSAPTSWTLDCYAIQSIGTSTANPAAPTGLSAVQVNKTTAINTSWSTNSSVLIYARKKGTTGWFPKPSYGSPFNGTSGQITMDANDTTYEIMSIAISDGLLSRQSSIFEIRITSTNAFAWDVAKTVGSNVITAAEWNKLIQHIVARRGSFAATSAVVGGSLSAAMYNQLISGMGVGPSYNVSVGQAVTAAKLNLLVTLANS